MHRRSGEPARVGKLPQGGFGHTRQGPIGGMGGIGQNVATNVLRAVRSGRYRFADELSVDAGPLFSGRDLHPRQAERRLHRDNDCVELTVTLAAAELDSLRPVVLKFSV